MSLWLAFCFIPLHALGQTGTEHWVATWATAQQLMATPPGGRSGAPPSNLPATFANQTVRMVVRISLGGSRVRVQLRICSTRSLLKSGAAHIYRQGRGAIVEGSDRVLTFGGSRTFTPYRRGAW